MALPVDKGRKLNFIFLLNWRGVIFRWNMVDFNLCDTKVYGLRFHWRDSEPRLWWEFRLTKFGGHASLTYSHGSKGSQKSGWTIRGPLVEFVKEHHEVAVEKAP